MQIKCDNLSITIYEGQKDAPLILMHEDHEEGKAVWELLLKGEVSCTLACISGMKWEHDLAPWDAPASFKKGEPFTGGADDHLDRIVCKVIPDIEKQLGYAFKEKYISGYSLAGLFAMYSVYRTDAFSGFVSASGSMWFPDFVKFAEEHKISKQVRSAYFSIGDKEAKTKNQMMQPVEENTRYLEHFLAERGIDTIFELNKGGHFVEDDSRLAKGIVWILDGGLHNVK